MTQQLLRFLVSVCVNTLMVNYLFGCDMNGFSC